MEKNVKVYFEESGDIRRFLLRSATQEQLFKQLGDAIATFWTENGKSFDMLYKDDENDFIKLSTPQEFEVCTSCPSNREILRIFVRKTNVGSQSTVESASSAVSNVVWKNVTCDKCSVNPVQGIRYKCILCPDYDECSKCFRTSPQHPHSMLALNNPNSEEWKMWLRHGSRRFGPHGSAGGPGHMHGHHRAGPRRCGGGGEGGAQMQEHPFGPFIKKYLDMAKHYAEQAGGASAAAGAAAGTSASASAAGIPGVNITQCDSGHPKVEVDVDMNELLTQPGNVMQTVYRAVEEVSKMVQSMGIPPNSQSQSQQASTSSQTVKTVMEDKKMGTLDAEPQHYQQDAEMKDVVVGVSTVPATAEEMQQQKVSTGSGASTPGTQTPRSEPTAPLGWTLLSDTANNAKDAVTICMENLKELGFDTDKTWLLELVKQCQGNLNRVMDELTPGAAIRLD